MAKLRCLPILCTKPRDGSLKRRRRGAIGALAAVLLVVMLACAAFAIDIGMICMAKAQLQRTADASALAAADELLHQLSQHPTTSAGAVEDMYSPVQGTAVSTAQANVVFGQSPSVALNPANAQSGEIVVGEMVRDDNGAASLSFNDPTRFNSVLVQVNRTAAQNGEVGLFFGRVLGCNSTAVSAQAQAAFIQSFKGFKIPSGGDDPPPTLMVLPFAVSSDAWQAAQSGTGQDSFGWDKDSQRVTSKGDGIREVNLYPLDIGSSGNFGTVDIGSNNSNTPTLQRQIVGGVTNDDLAFYGGALQLDASGKLILSGDPGGKLGAIQPELQQIVGQSRIIPIYSSVTGMGQNAQFTITGFAGCRIMDVQLTDADKHLTMQPAPIMTRGGIPGGSNTSSQIYSPVVLVR
jgi:Flp pilus assembly protein TadG